MSDSKKPRSSKPPDGAVGPTGTQIQDHLKKILGSSEFQATKQQRDFLRFVVLETLAGRADRLKGYTVATEVFGRTSDFNPSIDPIVSIQANKLRRALERYYLVKGAVDPFKIDIPKGGYVPTFIRQDVYSPRVARSSESVSENVWPTILIMPFKNCTGDPELNFIGSGFSTELAIEISGFENVRVFFPRDGSGAGKTTGNPRFLVNGELYKTGAGIQLAVYMIDTKTNEQIWGDTCQGGLNIEECFSFQENIIQVIAAKISGEFGIIPRVISKESRNKPPSELSTYEAILRFWEYEQTMSPESFKQAFEALSYAVNLEPENSQTLGSLSILYSSIYALDIAGFENPLERAVKYAEKAAAIAPDNQRIIAILAFSRFISDELASAIEEADRALNLNPNSLFVMDGLAWILTLSGEWGRGPELAAQAIRLNPYHRAVAHDALWVNHLREKKYDLAYKESLSCTTRPKLFWDPLIKATTSGLLGRDKEGQKNVDTLLKLRPDFPQKGRQLIKNYIKFEEIAERIEEGLRKVGLETL